MSPPLVWFGLDPSLTAFGWSVMGLGGLLDVGVWTTELDEKLRKKKGEKRKPGMTKDLVHRYTLQGERFIDLLERWTPSIVFAEAPIAAWGNAVQVIAALNRLFGRIEGACQARAIPLVEYGSKEVKRHLTGDSGAKKPEVATRVLQQYPGARVLLPGGSIAENITDALAVAHIGSSSDELAYYRSEHERSQRLSASKPTPPQPPVQQ